MKYATAHAFRTALETRIKQGQSDSSGVSRVRKRIVFERLLARPGSQAPGLFAPRECDDVRLSR